MKKSLRREGTKTAARREWARRVAALTEDSMWWRRFVDEENPSVKTVWYTFVKPNVSLCRRISDDSYILVGVSSMRPVAICRHCDRTERALRAGRTWECAYCGRRQGRTNANCSKCKRSKQAVILGGRGLDLPAGRRLSGDEPR